VLEFSSVSTIVGFYFELFWRYLFILLCILLWILRSISVQSQMENGMTIKEIKMGETPITYFKSY